MPYPPPHLGRATLALLLLLLLLVLLAGNVRAEIPTTLTDSIYKGSGTIDLMIDVLPSELEAYLQDGMAYLGVDLNEAASGLESSESVGVALKDLTLEIVTTDGTFSFSDFYTNTTAAIIEAGTTVAEEFYTLFGTDGSGANETFFDYSAGFEDLALLSSSDAELLDSQNFGITESTTSNVSYTLTAPTGSPEPAWWMILLVALSLQIAMRLRTGT